MHSTSIRVLVPALIAATSVFVASDLNLPLTAQATAPQVIASGRDNPRGLTFGPNGLLYVVEAGRGGPSTTLCARRGRRTAALLRSEWRHDADFRHWRTGARPHRSAVDCGTRG